MTAPTRAEEELSSQQRCYPILFPPNQEEKMKHHLRDVLHVDLLPPLPNDGMPEAMEAFSHFVLKEQAEFCLELLLEASEDDVGELQGGSDEHSIYRVSFASKEDESHNNTVTKMMNLFHSHYSSYRHILTIDTLRQYMLTMCNQSSRSDDDDIPTRYTRLGNEMLVLQFGGPTFGQVRHIDNMLPNNQICTYLSADCPTTLLYEMKTIERNSEQSLDDDDHSAFASIDSAPSLLELWRQQQQQQMANLRTNRNKQLYPRGNVPSLLVDTLQNTNRCNEGLEDKWYTRYFAFWGSLNYHLGCFGKLYQSVAYQHGLPRCLPGTTLLAGGNDVHAGPPSHGPRMFAFAIGIPETKEVQETTLHGSRRKSRKDRGQRKRDDNDNDGAGENEGEIQYSPAMLHADLCCLLFSILDYEYGTSNGDNDHDNTEEIHSAKTFLLEILVSLIQDHPSEWYLRQLDAATREPLLLWIKAVLQQHSSNNVVLDRLIQEGACSEIIFYSPDVVKRRQTRPGRRRRQSTKKNCHK